jgi:hypothetical protein
MIFGSCMEAQKRCFASFMRCSNHRMFQMMAPEQTAINVTRRWSDVVTLRLTPVPSAMYAARHAGHLGKSTRMMAGKDQRVRVNERRMRDDGAEIPSAVMRA